MSKRLEKKLLTLYKAFAIFSLFFQVFYPFLATAVPAQASTELTTEGSDLAPAEVSESSAALLKEILPAEEVEVELVEEAEVLSEETAEQPEFAGLYIEAVVLNETYVFVDSLGQEAQVTFTRIDGLPGDLRISEVSLTEEQQAETNSVSGIAYDITSSMPNGTFAYDLAILMPDVDEANLSLVYADDSSLEDVKDVEGEETLGKTLQVSGLDHFTVFVVTFEEAQDPTSAASGYNDIWFDYAGGTIIQVPSGTDGIVSADGDYHAKIDGPVYTRWGGYSSEFPALGYDTTVDVYLDMALADGEVDKRFDFSSAINNSDGNHRRDFIIHLGTNPGLSQQWLVSASNNSSGWPGNPDRNPANITETGWYTLEHSFRDVGGQLKVSISIYKKGNEVPMGSWVLSDSSDIIGTTVGGNRYGWFTSQRFDFDWLAIDNAQIQVFEPNVTTVLIPQDNTNWMFNRDTSTTSPYEFNSNQSSMGAGSLYILPISSNPSDKFIAENFMYEDISGLNSISYDYMIGAGGDVSDANHFYMNVYANFGESNPDKYYDCRYDVVPTVGSKSDFTTVAFNLSESYLVKQSGTSPRTCPTVPAEMENISSGSIVRAIALNVGDSSANDQALDGYLDNVVVDKGAEVIVYDFEEVVDMQPPAVPTGLHRINKAGDSIYQCGEFSTRQPLIPVWDKNEEADFSHYEYSSFHPSGAQGINEQRLDASRFEHNWTPTQDGPHGFAVRAVDTSGNKSGWAVSDESLAGSCQITYDSINPSKPSFTNTPNNKITNVNAITLNWIDGNDVGTYASGIKGYVLRYVFTPANGGTIKEWSTGLRPVGNTGKHSGSYGHGEGRYDFYVKTVDNVGNTSDESDVYTITYDATAPAAPTISSPTPEQYFNTTPILNDWTDVSDSSGIDFYRIEYKYDDGHTFSNAPYRTTTTSQRNHMPGLWEEGGVTIRVQAIDKAGNEGAWSGSVHYYYDHTAPSIPVVETPENGAVLNSSDLVKIDWSNSNDESPVEYKFQSHSNSDYTAPRYSSGWLTASEIPTPGTPEGNYYIRIMARDAAGNESAWSNGSENPYLITVDNTHPISTITSPNPDESFNDEILIEGSTTDANGVTEVVLSYANYSAAEDSCGDYTVITTLSDLANPTTYNWSNLWSPEAEGSYCLQAKGTDVAGNEENTSTVTNIIYDITIPTVDITVTPEIADGDRGWYKSQPAVSLNANDENEIDRIEYQWNSKDGAWTTYTGPIEPGQGNNTFYYRAIDKAGNGYDEIGTRTVLFDKEAPTEVKNFLIDRDGNKATIRWDDASDNIGIHRYEIIWELGDERYSERVGSDANEFTITDLADGQWEVRVRTIDGAGWTATTGRKGLTIGEGIVAGVSTVVDAIGDGIGGAFEYISGVLGGEVLGATDENAGAEEDGAALAQAAGLTGQVAGDSDTCSTWQYYLPIILLIAQLLMLAFVELFAQSNSVTKAVTALFITGAVMTGLYFLGSDACYSAGSTLGMIFSWFWLLALLLGLSIRSLGLLLIEEN